MGVCVCVCVCLMVHFLPSHKMKKQYSCSSCDENNNIMGSDKNNNKNNNNEGPTVKEAMDKLNPFTPFNDGLEGGQKRQQNDKTNTNAETNDQADTTNGRTSGMAETMRMVPPNINPMASLTKKDAEKN